MKQFKVAVIALFTLAIAGNVNAQDANNPWTLGFGVNAVDVRVPEDASGIFKDYVNGSMEDLNFLPSISRIAVGKYLEDGFSFQVAGAINRIERPYGFQEGDVLGDDLFWSVDAKVKYDLNNLVGETAWFDPFVLLGGGYAAMGDVKEGRIAAGWGFNTWFNDNLGLSFQSDYNHAMESTGTDYFQHSVGLVFKFGGTDTDGDGVYDKFDACPEVAGLEAFNGCPDSDADGIKDSEDACPNVAGLAALNGCPDADEDGIADKNDMCPNVAGLAALNGCPDADKDGVADKDDKCATVAGPAANKGCPWPDTDKDGLLDKDDACPNVAGPASNKGCPVIISDAAEMIVDAFEKVVLFKTESSSFKADAFSKLDEIVAIMNEFALANFQVAGHTDNTGSPTGNMKLSIKRANMVRDYFVSKGIAAERLVVKGFGETAPLVSNKTMASRKNNRRVDLNVTNK